MYSSSHLSAVHSTDWEGPLTVKHFLHSLLSTVFQDVPYSKLRPQISHICSKQIVHPRKLELVLSLLAYPLLIYFKSYTVDLPWHSTKGEPATILNIFPCIWVFILKHLPALYQIRSCWRRAHPHLSVHTQGLCLWGKKTLLNQMRLWFLTNNCIKVW